MREIVRKCVAMICGKYRITRISSIGVDMLVDVTLFRISLTVDVL